MVKSSCETWILNCLIPSFAADEVTFCPWKKPPVGAKQLILLEAPEVDGQAEWGDVLGDPIVKHVR